MNKLFNHLRNLYVCWLVIIHVSSSLDELSHPLHILSLLPYADSNGKYGWDKGLELLPAARIAVRHVNNRSDVLPGYTINLIERASDACGRSFVIKGLENFVANSVSPFDNSINAIAVVGLACSTVTATVSPISGALSILQIAMSNSQLLRDTSKFPHLWRMFSSSDVLVEATVSLMEQNNWQRVGLISDGSGFFFRSIARSFRQEINTRNFTLVVDEAIDFSPSIISSAVERIQSEGVRIIFLPTSIPESVEIMCQAAKKNLIWPGYVWIFPSRTYSELISNSNRCDEGELFIQSLENVTLVDLEVSGRNDDDILVSGITYEQYSLEYEMEYEKVQKEYIGSDIIFDTGYNVYANAMYDEVWALALAINSSLQELQENDFDLRDYRYNMPDITMIIEKHLKDVSFSGALSNIRFNEFNEVPTIANIFQVRGEEPVQIGFFTNKNLTLWNIDDENIPDDDFVRKYNYLNSGFVISLYVNAIILFICTSVLLVVSLWLRKEPEILAISPLLSILIFIGCYLLSLASILTATNNFTSLPTGLYVVICYLQVFSAQTGINLITATVLIRLVRIYRIFTHFGKTSKFWQDKYLFFVIILISCISDIVTVIGIAVDPLQATQKEEYLLYENPPIILLTPECKSESGFSTYFDVISQIYTGLLVILLLAFAILTRKVNKRNFKDTKKISVFVFLFTIVASISYVLSDLFASRNEENIAIIIRTYSYQLLVVLCLAILIAPKAIPAFYYHVYKNKKRSFYATAEKDATISKRVVTSLRKTITSKTNLFSSSSSNF